MKHRPFGRTGKTDVATVPDRSCAITHSPSPSTPTSTASAASPVGVRDADTSTAAGANPAAERLSRTCAVLGCGEDATSACRAAATDWETPEGAAVADADGDADAPAVSWAGASAGFPSGAGALFEGTGRAGRHRGSRGRTRRHPGQQCQDQTTSTVYPRPLNRRPRGRRSGAGSREVIGIILSYREWSAGPGDALRKDGHARPRPGDRCGHAQLARPGVDMPSRELADAVDMPSWHAREWT